MTYRCCPLQRGPLEGAPVLQEDPYHDPLCATATHVARAVCFQGRRLSCAMHADSACCLVDWPPFVSVFLPTVNCHLPLICDTQTVWQSCPICHMFLSCLDECCMYACVFTSPVPALCSQHCCTHSQVVRGAVIALALRKLSGGCTHCLVQVGANAVVPIIPPVVVRHWCHQRHNKPKRCVNGCACEVSVSVSTDQQVLWQSVRRQHVSVLEGRKGIGEVLDHTDCRWFLAQPAGATCAPWVCVSVSACSCLPAEFVVYVNRVTLTLSWLT